jgi:hypothetical protein
MYVRDSLTFGAPEWELTRGYDLVHDKSMQLPPLHLSHDGRETMRKLLLGTAAAIMLAGPALAQTKMITVNLSGVVKPKGGGPSTASTIVPIVPIGTATLIAVGNRVDVYNPVTNTVVPGFTVTVPLGSIIDMVFNMPSFLTVQGGGPFAVTIDYSTFPPTVGPAVAL